MHDPALKLNLFVGFPSYGGNGGISSEVPDIREWWTDLVVQLKDDPRIGKVFTKTVADTPITMVRNDFVRMAVESGCHLLMMVDSDQSPNKHRHEPWFKPFWDEAFNFIYDNYGKGPRMVFAPYVGPQENVYVFKWSDGSSTKYNDESFELKPYDRQEAALMSGIHEAGAGPTGLILIDLRLCEIIEPSRLSKRAVLERLQTGLMTVEEASWALQEGYFYYEWESQYANKKASTEDVTFTRNASLAGIEKLGYNPVFCAWDSWIGHYKPINVGRPQRFTAEHVHSTLRKSVVENSHADEGIIDLSTIQGIPDFLKRLAEPPPGYFDRKPDNGHSNGHSNGKIDKHYWHPLASAMAKVSDALPDGGVIVDIGPGNIPMPRATHFVGKMAPDTKYNGTFYELDLDKARLPFDDGEVDFVYCRHVLEDLKNPEHLLAEIKRVAKAGYIETPSPMAEASHGVNNPDSTINGRGYPHHHSVIWSAFDGLKVLPKMPVWEKLDLPDHSRELDIAEMWNSYHFWKGELNYTVLKNDKDYLLGVDDRYEKLAVSAIEHSRVRTGELFDKFAPTTDTWKDGCRETTGPWFSYGSAPAEQKAVLADLVRSEGYAKQPTQDTIRILEVGSWLGGTAIAMADASTMARVHCVDTWNGSPTDETGKHAIAAGGPDAVFAEFCKRVGDKRLDKSIFPFRGTSAEMAAKYWDKFDIIFIDAEHTYEALKADIENWWPHLKDDGIMLGHDFNVAGHPGVGQAVREAFGENFRTVGWTPQGCMWQVRKQDHPELLEKQLEPATV